MDVSAYAVGQSQRHHQHVNYLKSVGMGKTERSRHALVVGESGRQQKQMSVENALFNRVWILARAFTNKGSVY